MLWDIVFEFYVKNIFGGLLRVNNAFVYYHGTLGVAYVSGGDYVDINTGQTFLTNFSLGGNPYQMPLGNYLSLIATIISMVVIVLICCALIKKIYNMCAHIIG